MRIEPEKRLIKYDKNPDVLNISKAVTIESGNLTLTSGSVAQTSGDLTLTAGDLTLTLGDLNMTAGDFVNTLGDLTITAGNILNTLGNLTLTAGDFVITLGDATLTAGDLLLTLGDFTMTSGNALLTSGTLTLTSGNVIITAGSLVQTVPAELFADPGDAGTVTLTSGAVHNQVNVTTAGASETRVMGVPQFIGQECIIRHAVDGGDFDMTNASGWNGGTTSDDVASFAEAEDVMVLKAGGLDAVDWREIANVGVAIA